MLPEINVKGGKTRRQVVELGGLNRTEDFRAGELADCKGLSALSWPCLGQRKGRRWYSSSSPGYTGVSACAGLLTQTGTSLNLDGRFIGKVTEGEKQFAAVGDQVCVFPDKKYLDRETMSLKDLAAEGTTVPATVRFEPGALVLRAEHTILAPQYVFEKTQSGGIDIRQRMSFMAYRAQDISWSALGGWSLTGGQVKTMSQLEVGDCFMLPWYNDGLHNGPVYDWNGDGGYNGPFDPSGDFVCLCQRPEFDTSYVKLTLERRNARAANPDLSALGLQPGDTVRLSGCVTLPENDLDLRIVSVESDRIDFEESLLVAGDEEGAVRIARDVPDLDFVCSANGRLVGVNNAQRRIYLSAQNDPRNFYDSRPDVGGAVLDVPDAGAITGCTPYGSGVLFFQEDRIHRLMGDHRSNFALYTDQVPGLQAGSHRSLAVLNGALYYKGRDGVYAYTGSTPRLVSRALGNVSYQNAAAGSDGRRYLISMEREDTGTWELLAYDSRTGLWLKEDDVRVRDFAWYSGRLYALIEATLYLLNTGEGDKPANGDETPISWEALFVPFDEATFARKYPSRLLLRLELDPGAWVEAEIARDGGPFQRVWTCHDLAGPTAVIPIRPGRCDRWQLRLKGTGPCLVRSMAREFHLGGVR